MSCFKNELRPLTAPGFAVALLASAVAPALAQVGDENLPDFSAAIERADDLAPLETLLIAVDGETLVDEGFDGHSTDRPTNIKSASKSVISALIGIAIEKGVLDGADQPIAPLLKDKLPDDPDPRLSQVTIGNLLSMQAGLERTSGPNYGEWVASRDWAENALSRPFVADPGGPMLYSTGSTHLLSAILTRETGRSTLALLRDWLGEAGVDVASWERDPQGIYLGGNQMAMTPKSLLAFGELYRNEGRDGDGNQVVPADWVEESWIPRTRSRFSGEPYGYGWFEVSLGGHEAHYGWGYGGQMVYVLPDLEATVVVTSDAEAPSARTGYKDDLHALVAEAIVPAIKAARSGAAGSDEADGAEAVSSPPHQRS